MARWSSERGKMYYGSAGMQNVAVFRNIKAWCVGDYRFCTMSVYIGGNRAPASRSCVCGVRALGGGGFGGSGRIRGCRLGREVATAPVAGAWEESNISGSSGCDALIRAGSYPDPVAFVYLSPADAPGVPLRGVTTCSSSSSSDWLSSILNGSRDALFFLRRYRRKRATRRSIPVIPPTIPPTIAPTGVLRLSAAPEPGVELELVVGRLVPVAD